MQNTQQVWQSLAAELGAIDIAMQGAYKVFSCMDEEEVKVCTLLFEMEIRTCMGLKCPACRVFP